MQDKIDHNFEAIRRQLVFSMTLGYVFYYFTRNSIKSLLPALQQVYGITNLEVGSLVSLIAITYGFSKFIGGILSDKSNPKTFMFTGLLITGICNILIGYFGNFNYIIVFCIINTFFQGWGWPPCAKQLTLWFRKSERGSWWSIVSLSHNIGGMAIPLLSAKIYHSYGLAPAFYFSGFSSISVAIMGFIYAKGTPEQYGYRLHKEYDIKAAHSASKRLLILKVISNKYIWLMSGASFFIYIIREAMNSWLPKLLLEKAGYSNLMVANAGLTFFELGGLLGMLLAGFIADKRYNGRRTPVMLVFVTLLIGATSFIWRLIGYNFMLDFSVLFIFGALLYGPQMLVGLMASEYVSKDVVGTANGFIGIFACLGAASAGIPISYLLNVFGWTGYFFMLVFSGVLVFFMILITIFFKDRERYLPINSHFKTV